MYSVIRRLSVLLAVMTVMLACIPSIAVGSKDVFNETYPVTPLTLAQKHDMSKRLRDAEAGVKMSFLEQRFVEIGLRLVPYDHPIVIAYENTYGVKIDSFTTEYRGVKLSGVPFYFGGNGGSSGFSKSWWHETIDSEYPVYGLDCTEYLRWIYYQLGYIVEDSSSALFLSGVTGEWRELPGIDGHYVIPSFEEAKIGDVCYNSQNYRYHSGHGSHTQMFLGTADYIGISEELLKLIPDFPTDAYLTLDCGWSDGMYYYNMMRSLGIHRARKSMSGVGVQFFTSVKQNGEYLYKSPELVKWTNPDTKHTFRIEARLERDGRYLQYKSSSDTEYIMNISRPIVRGD